MFVDIFILIFMNCVSKCLCFHVNFNAFYGAQLEPFNTQIQKREMAQFFDKAAYSFNGLSKIESVPVSFPTDICILSMEGIKYAVSLHRNKNGVRHLTVYKNVNNNYNELHNIAMPNAVAMDCKALASKGYIALAFNLTQTIENAREGSPIYVLTADDRLRAVQFFDTKNLYSIYLRTVANDLFMLQTLRSSDDAPNPHCPYYKWSGTSFTLLARIPCSNARHVEPFAINYENYVALANYADQKGRTTTYSEIYKFIREKKRFQLFQKIRTYGAVDVRYFSAPLDEVKRRHFLVYGNSMSRSKSAVRGEDTNEADSVFYVFDKGQFVPYQSLSLYAVEQFLPVQNVDAEKFLLLVACKDQDTKIYNLNDWKFEPSNVQFTEGALGRGVSKMRIHQENEQSFLVIANEKMTENDTNIFLPIFKQDEHANALRQQIIDWTKTQIERLVQIDINKLQQDVEQKLSQGQRPNINTQVTVIPQANIQTVHTNAFIYPKHHFTSHYWQALNFATQAVNGIEAELKSATKARLKRATPTTDAIKEFANIRVDSLIIKHKLEAQQVNGVKATRPTFERIKAKKVRVTGMFQATERALQEDASTATTPTVVAPTLAVNNLQINGLLNDYKWNDLLNYTLKREGAHFLEKSAHIGNLLAESVRVLSADIDGNHLNDLIPIDDGNGTVDDHIYMVNQSVLFEAPVKAKELFINERLNHINVQEHTLDVLLKRVPNVTRVIEGVKAFENVRILQPVTMAVSVGGRTLGSSLQSLSSQQIIHDDLVLNGDFTIKGDAIISNRVSVGDLLDRNTEISTKKTLENGIDITQMLANVNIKFEQPVEANNTLLTFINTVDLQQLIKTNFKSLQLIEGEKHFKQTLEIRRGFSEVKNLNGVDIEKLSERFLFKSFNQTITAPMHLGSIQTSNVITQNLKLKDKPIETYVTSNGHQHLPVTLTVAELSARSLNIERLHTNGHIFGKSVNPGYEQPLMAQLLSNMTKGIDLLTPRQKFPNTIFVGNLRLSDGSINGRKVQAIEKQLQHLNADIHFEGSYKFNYNMNISHLTFQGKFNDIPAMEFGQSWLQKSGRQVFTSPQSLSEVNCLKEMQLDGKLNGHRIDDFFADTYWINRNEYIDTMDFRNPIQMEAMLSTTTLNGIHVPLDIVNANSTAPQTLYASAFIHGQLNALGSVGIYNVSTLNGINLRELERFLRGVGGDTFHVEHASFAQAPLYHTLNRYELSMLLDKVWLANENVRLSQHVELANATFEGLLEFEGLVNNINLQYLKENYLSLSRAQDMRTELILASETKFEGALSANNIQLAGMLVENSRNSAMNFDEFVANTLKTDGSHEVRASWSLVSALIQENLDNVQINNLNLAHDVLRLDTPCAPVTAPKHLISANIRKLHTTTSSSINGIPINDWMQTAIYVQGNHTINGNITLNTVNMYKDLSVLGTVNGISNFGEQTLLLRNIGKQIIHGDIYINSLLSKNRGILVNSFENLSVNSINGQQLDDFYVEIANISKVVTVDGNLTFLQPLVVQEYHNRATSDSKRKRNISTVNEVVDNEITEMPTWKDILTSVQQLKWFVDASYYILNTFKIRQKIPVNATKMVHFKLNEEDKNTMDIIGIMNENNEHSPIMYYKWSLTEEQFQPIQGYYWLPKQAELIDIAPILFSKADDYFAVLNKHNSSYLLSNLKLNLENLLDGEQFFSNLKRLTIEGEHCFATQAISNNGLTKVYCISKEIDSQFPIYEKFVIPGNGVQELLQVNKDTIATLLTDTVEIWTTHPSLNLKQSLFISKSMKMASTMFNNNTFLAIQCEKQANSLHGGRLEIYSSTNSTNFGHLQTLDCSDVIQISFEKVTRTGDLLLFTLRRNIDASLTIYQYKGVTGFQQIVGATTLPAIHAYQLLHLENAHKEIIALTTSEGLLFVEIVLRKF
uniref:Closca n=1 Tax=Bactrocera latifrons TaxID=174628 RepID=A0A0K8V1F0_BACLA